MEQSAEWSADDARRTRYDNLRMRQLCGDIFGFAGVLHSFSTYKMFTLCKRIPEDGFGDRPRSPGSQAKRVRRSLDERPFFA
jgi:hypothetical protein